MMNVLKSPSWDRHWIISSPITLLVVEFHMKTSLTWTEVYEENIFLLELICCEHSESMTHLFLLPTGMSVTDRTSHCSSSSPINSVTLASGCFFFQSQQSTLVSPFCDNSCMSNSYILSCPWNFNYYSSPLNNEVDRNHHDETHSSTGCQFCPCWTDTPWPPWPWLLTCLHKW